YSREDSWQETMLASRAALTEHEAQPAGKKPRPAGPDGLTDQGEKFALRIMLDFPIEWDWYTQDAGKDFLRWLAGERSANIETKMIARVLNELGPAAPKLRAAAADLAQAYPPPADRRWLDLYVNACRTRRAVRLKSGKCDLTYRNVALNPLDVQKDPTRYPHASSNSEYGNRAPFLALNCIDGKTANTGHGGRFPSWGPDKRTDLWWKVEFGRAVTIDKLCLWIRADFPHDRHWHSATVEFSDGGRLPVKIGKTKDQQVFRFKERTVTWLRFTDLVQDEPLGWCGFSEVQVWGRPAGPGEAKAVKGAPPSAGPRPQ
ncbi:MAG: hypothetical protein WBF17_15230, partial [Phycisphaerae bacterium]